MEQWNEIRRRILVEGVSRRQVQRETGMHWKTLKKVLARSARFMDWCVSPGMIWPQSNDSIDLLTQDEKLEGMEVLARTCGKLKTTALCLGVQGRDTDEMLVYAKHAWAIEPPPTPGLRREGSRGDEKKGFLAAAKRIS